MASCSGVSSASVSARAMASVSYTPTSYYDARDAKRLTRVDPSAREDEVGPSPVQLFCRLGAQSRSN